MVRKRTVICSEYTMTEALEQQLETLQIKYKNLRRKHRKLAGLALTLADALEAYVKDDKKPDISSVLLSCSNLYPGLMAEEEKKSLTVPDIGTQAVVAETNTEIDILDTETKAEADEDEKKDEGKGDEYYEAFWSRPKISRTPQISSE